MPRFIKLKGKYPVYINVDRIESVYSYCLSEGRHETRVMIDSSFNNQTYYQAEETVEEIMEMING